MAGLSKMSHTHNCERVKCKWEATGRRNRRSQFSQEKFIGWLPIANLVNKWYVSWQGTLGWLVMSLSLRQSGRHHIYIKKFPWALEQSRGSFLEIVLNLLVGGLLWVKVTAWSSPLDVISCPVGQSSISSSLACLLTPWSSSPSGEWLSQWYSQKVLLTLYWGHTLSVQ